MSESQVLKVKCPNCPAVLRVKTKSAEKTVTCPKCSGLVVAAAVATNDSAADPKLSEATPPLSDAGTKRKKGIKCPDCGSRKYSKVPAMSKLSLTMDRCCSKCGTCYIPPIPLWGLCLLLLGMLAIPGYLLIDAKNAGDRMGALWLAAGLGAPVLIGILVRVLQEEG